MRIGLDFSCVLKSQLIRFLAFNFPFIRDEDVIVTSDVDAFIMTKDILDPLEMYFMQIWLYQYIYTLKLVPTYVHDCKLKSSWSEVHLLLHSNYIQYGITGYRVSRPGIQN